MYFKLQIVLNQFLKIMIRNAFVMQLKKGCEAEYKKRHDTIWPELKSLLIQSGINSYYVFLEEESGKLFAFQSLVNTNTTAYLSNDPIMKKWWKYMADLMETNLDSSPLTTPLAELFSLE